MAQKNFLIDMDGVLISGNQPIEGANEFIGMLKSKGYPFLVTTNNSAYTPRDLAHRLQHIGLEIEEGWIFTSAMATAKFIQSQKPNGKAFIIGESGLTEAFHRVGYILTDQNPDYVVLGETENYSFPKVTTAVRLIMNGAIFVATNPDPNGPTEQGVVPACGSMASLIATASGKKPFFTGKPNPLMMRFALNYLGAHSEQTTMIGDRMDTDVIAGIESGMQTILVLSGICKEEEIGQYPYRPHHVFSSLAAIDLNQV
ncbi:MAG: HAD family hydrolase [Anaerolineaceae bacterium]|nr:HAD family hydrolase [Anaerolineaceae bacterium]